MSVRTPDHQPSLFDEFVVDNFAGGGGASGAVIDGDYRYLLWRRWALSCESVVWVMLNPSTADAEIDDPTIRRCVGFARDWGYGGIYVVNLYGLRATDPDELLGHPNPVGPRNDDYITAAISRVACIVAAWGGEAGRRAHAERTHAVMDLLRTLAIPRCLGLTQTGHPRHPLYVPAATPLVPFTPASKR